MHRTTQLTTRTTQLRSEQHSGELTIPLVLPDYLADLQNLTVVMLINHLVCRNKLLKNNVFTVKNDCQHLVHVSPELLFFMCKRQAFPLQSFFFLAG
jgi:hypothetical protein